MLVYLIGPFLRIMVGMTALTQNGLDTSDTNLMVDELVICLLRMRLEGSGKLVCRTGVFLDAL
jgi:hypothetical protein